MKEAGLYRMYSAYILRGLAGADSLIRKERFSGSQRPRVPAQS